MSKLAHPDGRRRPSLMKKKSWFKIHRRLVMILAIALAVIVVMVVAVFAVLNFFNNRNVENDQLAKPIKKVEPVRYYSPLTGRETTEKKTAATVLAVMIENSPEARPQSGLIEAGVVFEAVAEGGITRFLVIYQESEPALIGPVRSIRPYYVEWAAAFDSAVAHVGGSDEAISMMRNGNYGVDLDQFYNDSTYWRVKDRYAPHNVYTDYTHLSQLAESKGKMTSNFIGFTRETIKSDSDSTKTADTPAIDIKFDISGSQYVVSYHYDEATKTYQRSVGGKSHLSRSLDKITTQITPDVVIAIRVKQTLAADGFHNQITTTGSGEAFVFQNGQVIKGTWSKTSVTSQIYFYDETDNEIELKRGQTWITAIPASRAITWETSSAP
ncbi:DUF3048 domain-containing protein [Candidatus Saccharibacteria bacterium]|nr:DUF3048 domain-containing protein [Candidatus Saccharibacteria bacterium]